MDKIFIFDVDGTLTPSRLPMTKEFQDFFSIWSKMNKFYLVTGSDLPKLQEQMCYFDIEAERIFTCCGNQMWKPNPSVPIQSADLIYENKFTPPESLIEYLKNKIESSKYYHRAGNHIENRDSMLNFSVVGRNCTQEQREDYFKWDSKVDERKNIANDIKSIWTKLDAVIGGQISIDIYPKGNDKSQVLEHIEKLHRTGKIIFIGDGIENGGNDYPLAHLMDNITDCDWYQTKGWEQTKQILESLID
jgi:phosphomannomutase